MSGALLDRPAGKSMLDPFDTGELTQFNVFYVLVGILSSVYSYMAWQGTQAFNCSAASAHEQKMGGILGRWRGGYAYLMIVMLAVAGYTYLNHPDFHAGGEAVRAELVQKINLASSVTTEQIRDQMQIPLALKHFLPIGVSGIFVALMLFLMTSTDVSYLHSWGSIFIQDCVLPLRKKPFTPPQQLLLLRLSITFVAVFSFFFSLLFCQTTYILMFFALTGSIFLGGAGSCILGGLYWKKGTAAGAWGAMIVGSSLAALGFFAENRWASHIYPWLDANAPGFLGSFKVWLEWLGDVLPFVEWEVGPKNFPLSGQEIYFITMVCSVTSYIVLSLLTCREDFNMDRMFHRGKYAREEKQVVEPAAERPGILKKLLGIDEQFTTGDKILSWSVFIWTMANFGVFLAVAGWNLFMLRWPEMGWTSWIPITLRPPEMRWSKYGWANYFFIMQLVVGAVVGAVTTVWFTIGGALGLRDMFRRLAELKRSVLDDGRVIGHVSADDVALVEKVEHITVKEAHEAEKELEEALSHEEPGLSPFVMVRACFYQIIGLTGLILWIARPVEWGVPGIPCALLGVLGFCGVVVGWKRLSGTTRAKGEG
jgi:SSS family solute:Na+ symporter